MVEIPDLIGFMRTAGAHDHRTAARLLAADPSLARARLDRRDESFIAACHAQVYAGDTALHAAAFAYDADLARQLVTAGADVRARNRRGAEPIHAAVIGVPGSSNWDPRRQVAVITCLIDAGADPNAPAVGGVTPLHRAVRNRCSAAVRTLLDAGADPSVTTDGGSTPRDLAGRTTGRGGSGSPAAKAEQVAIIEALAAVTGRAET